MLEQSIDKLIATVERNNELMEKLIEISAPGAEKPAPAEEKAEKKAPPKKKAAPKKEEKKPEPEPEKAEEKNEAAEELDYDADVKPFVIANAKDHRDEIVGVLSRYGLKKATGLEPHQYREFLDRLKNAIDNGLETDSEFMETYNA